MNTSGAETRDRALVRFLPRHWKKRSSCRRRSCDKRRVHWHWIPTSAGLDKMMRRVWTSPIVHIVNEPNPLLGLAAR